MFLYTKNIQLTCPATLWFSHQLAFHIAWENILPPLNKLVPATISHETYCIVLAMSKTASLDKSMAEIWSMWFSDFNVQVYIWN